MIEENTPLKGGPKVSMIDKITYLLSINGHPVNAVAHVTTQDTVFTGNVPSSTPATPVKSVRHQYILLDPSSGELTWDNTNN